MWSAREADKLVFLIVPLWFCMQFYKVLMRVLIV